MAAVATDRIITPDLADLVQQTERTELSPLAFFVSWHGVLTIAYRGFTIPLMNLKARINELYELPKENSGSKWPKTTLAALRDGVNLTQDQYERLQNLCKRLSANLAACTVKVDALAIVNYACRSLERVTARHSIDLTSSSSNSNVLETEKISVERVLSEADDPDYWQMVAKQGSRESHYQAYAPGCTLIVPLKGKGARTLQNAIQTLQEEVEKALPDFYTFFDPKSHHVTLRAISG